MRKSLLIILSMFLFSACESYNQDDYQEIVVVESYLIAGRNLPDIRVSKTLPIADEYTFEDAGLSNAIIQVTLLDDEGNEEDLFEYAPQSQNRGVYSPVSSSHRILPQRTYKLTLNFIDRDEILQAQTTVPDQVTVANEVQREVVYQSDNQLEIILAASETTQDQKFFVFDSLTLEPSQANLTPFYRAAVVDGDSEISDFFKNSSGLINEGNFDINPDGTISLRFPWIGAAFYGETLVVTNSVDQNLAELVRSQEVQLGGSTLSPGEIPNLDYNIEGGIGIFGSISSDTVQTRFLRP